MAADPKTDVLFEPPNWRDREEQMLAPYAMRTALSRGRQFPEADHPYRTLYQRDRDRIVHSTAFRRLLYKTQVLVNQVGDHHRTRMTHTLEVAQIGRTVARVLGLNEDLTEACALAHDLGHPPFGHAGEDALHDCMREHGGFEHNLHGLRIVTQLEYRYANFTGLNLSWEVLESMALHSKRREAPEVKPFAAAGRPILEAQVVDAADSLAYDTHDIDDALSVGLISLADLNAVEICRRAADDLRRRHGELAPEQFQPALVRTLIDWQVGDLLEHTRRRLRAHQVRGVDDVRRCPELIVAPGPELRAWKAERFLTMMFEELCRTPEQLPLRYAERARKDDPARVVCDYLAGMTDRYAQDEYLRLFQPYTEV